MKSLHNLPAGAVFTATEGRATAQITVKGDTLVVTATCDSLQQMVFRYEAELVRIRDELTQKEKVTSNSRREYFVYGLLAGALIVIIIKPRK